MSDCARRFYYLVALHNEAATIAALVADLESGLITRFPESRVLLLENGSTDDTWKLCRDAEAHKPWIRALRAALKGQGAAFRLGFQALEADGLGPDDVVVLTAADLPFGFSDLEAYLQLDVRPAVAIGSKFHPFSEGLPRSPLRACASSAFRFARSALLGLDVRDTQGVFFIRGDVLPTLEGIHATDFFFTTEIAYWIRRRKLPLVEIPVRPAPEFRPSKVRLVHDGFSLLKKTWRLYREHGRIVL